MNEDQSAPGKGTEEIAEQPEETEKHQIKPVNPAKGIEVHYKVVKIYKIGDLEKGAKKIFRKKSNFGGMAGAAAGAYFGTAIFPGLGTVVGTGLGAAIG